MFKTAKYMMRVALAIMVFQFFAPSFLPSVVQRASSSKTTSIHTPHSSIVAPQFLKEKDEKGDENISSVANLTAILDFADHSFNLTATHKGKASHFHHEQWYDSQPAIFTRLHSFLI